ncbi:Crp/Fnr family transcriptional regulator [Pseudohoeflea coraliihabitans]|uniref:Crp/Fnr family transcriptional regulator n=1 Tax=Pseudohoeflea coraliihabitans TaxID=2860393 RepID=A0ABS6WQQ9_9HYPH|nr:Crp/Fnr family transcriptional regulator [Pseudohoeflea sp. DP4N28-3]MBW3098293.1 Crp/Fnr family transcriptional regulator [Pseudohoeflea sp. DP4N28-3]
MPALDRSLIGEIPGFAGLSEADLDRVLSLAHASRFEKDATIFAQGEEAHSFFLLLSGHVRVVKTTPEGHQVIARYINEGELFGLAIFLGRSDYPADAVAAVDCVVLTWPNSAAAELQKTIPGFGGAAYQTIGARLQDTQSRVMELSTQQVEQRIAHTVLRLVRQSGRKVADGIEIDFPITRQDIAEMTGTTLHTVSRILSAWEEAGLVRGGRQKVIVTDPHGLMLIAEHRR